MRRKSFVISTTVAVLLGAAAFAGGAMATGESSQSSATQSTASDRIERLGWPATSSRPAGAVLKSARAAAAQSGGEVLAVVEIAQDSVLIPVGEEFEQQPGDAFLFESRVRNETETRRIGSSSVRCELGFEGFTCEATTFIFGRGKLMIAGTTFPREDVQTFAITGGTGEFKKASGQLFSSLTENGDTLNVFHIVR